MLTAYLRRIGLGEPVPATLSGLQRLMTAHLSAIPFENIDVFLGRKGARGIDAIHAKLVEQRRGGWCYEQNGLFGWALDEMGFDVIRVPGRVNKAEGEPGGHLALLVSVQGQPWLVDVGFGGGQARPLPLEPHVARHEPFAVSLSNRDGWWRYTEDPGGKPFFYEFRPEPADPDRLAYWNAWQESDPASNFVGNLVAQRRLGTEHLALRGRVLTSFTTLGATSHLVEDARELVALLHSRFGLDVPGVAEKWPAITARHEELFGAAGG